MKHSMLAVAVALCGIVGAGGIAQAQDSGSEISSSYRTTSPAPSRIKLVPMVGVSSAGIEGFDMPGNSTVLRRNLLNAGILTEIGSGPVSMQTGLVYMQEGFSTTILEVAGTSVVNGYADARLDYVGIPLIAKINVPTRGSGATIYGKAGVIPAYAASVDMKWAASSGGYSASGEEKGRDGIRNVNVFGQLGAGLGLLAGSNEMRIEALYERALLSNNMDGGSQKVYTNSLMLNVGMALGIL